MTENMIFKNQIKMNLLVFMDKKLMNLQQVIAMINYT